MAKKGKRKKLTIIEQSECLRSLFPDSEIHTSRHELYWKGRLGPSACSQTYTVELKYKYKDGIPKVYVLEPKLKVPEGKSLPHVYVGDRLCLYNFGDWKSDMLLGRVIVPWISEWLLYYEIWLVTGEWHGGGVHPVKKEEIKDEEF